MTGPNLQPPPPQKKKKPDKTYLEIKLKLGLPPAHIPSSLLGF